MRRLIAVLISLVLTAGAIGPGGAGRSAIPGKPNIVDVAGDANGSDTLDQPGVLNVAEADLLSGWVTADKHTVSVHWLLAASPADKGVDLVMRAVDAERLVETERKFPGRCLWFSVEFPNPEAGWEPYGYLHDNCTYPGTLAEVTSSTSMSFPLNVGLRELADGRAIVTATASRRASPLFAQGKVLDHLDAMSALFRGYGGKAFWGRLSAWDTTRPGRDYRMP